jgi:hypothetical protein
MALQAPAIVDVRPTGASGTFGTTTWLRGIGVRQVRLATGLVLFTYIFSHFFNHALGNISYAAMENWLTYHIWFWRIPVVNFVLYAAAMTHAGLGLWALYQRRHFRYTVAEITQLALGLSIPLLIAGHLGAVRGSGLLFGRDPPNYAAALLTYWTWRPHLLAVQFTLLTVAWIHGCIGLYFWLRLKPFFKWASPYFLAVAVLLPPLAMLGAHQGARDVIRIASPQWQAEHVRGIPPEQLSVLEQISLFYFPRWTAVGASHEHDESEHLDLRSASLAALEPSETSFCRMAKPPAFALRVVESQRQVPARYRRLALRRGVRSIQVVLDGVIDRECLVQPF